MDSTDDGFHSGAHDLTGGEESTRKSLLNRERELKAICNQLCLSPPNIGKAVQEKLDKYSRYLAEKGITEVSRAHIIECHAREVLKRDDLKALESEFFQLHASYAHLLETTQDLNTLHKKAIKSLQKEAEKNKKNLESIQPYFSRPDEDSDQGSTIDGRADLVRRAALAVKKLSQKKLKKPQDIREISSAAVTENVLPELEAKTLELQLLNKRLEELGLQ